MVELEKKTPWHLWIVGILGVLWNAIGANDYTQTQLGNRDYFEVMGFGGATADALLEFMQATPAWAHAAWALGVWGGLIGSVLLLFRSGWAVTAFAVSMLGLIGSTVHQATAEFPPELADMQMGAMFFVVWAIAIFLLAYAARQRRNGNLR